MFNDFSWALQQLKAGYCVTRNHWPEGWFLYMVKGSKFTVNREPLLSIAPEGTEISYQPHIDIFMPGNRVAVFTFDQSDIFAEDYYVVEPQHERKV